jgi:phage shock protein A
MAGLVSRLKRITVSRIKAFLETVDQPEAVFPQLVREMQRGIEEAISAEIKATAALKANQRRLDESQGRSIRLWKGAEMALRQGDETLAREALAEQIKADSAIDSQRLALSQSETALLEAHEGRLHLEAQLDELKRRKTDIIARARSAGNVAANLKRAGKIRETGAAILDEVSRMEQAEDENDFLYRATGDMSATLDRSLELRLRALEREAEIERRLASIRKKKQSKSMLDA